MHLQFLGYFVDPDTKEPLELETISLRGDIVETGFLKSSTGKYPIVRGVPRFVEHESGNYSKSFGYEWQKWPRVQFEADNIGRPMEGHTRRMWERITGFSDGAMEIKDAVIADIGCGPGRFIDVVRSKGAKVIGIDYSDAVEVAARNFRDDPDVCTCQANALNLPLKPNSIGGAFSIGVLHHTPDPERGVREAYRILHRYGWFALCVYEKGGYYDLPEVQRWRKLFQRMWPVFKHHPPLLYAYFTVCVLRPLTARVPSFAKAIHGLCPFVDLPDVNWSLLDTFDSVTPSYQSAHESDEVFAWLKKTGFIDIKPTNWGFTSYRGIKGGDGRDV